MTLSDRELATVLAALRFWQAQVLSVAVHEDQVVDDALPADLQAHFTDVTPLLPDEVDRLCEDINVSHGRHAPGGVICTICHRVCRSVTAHRHQHGYVGDECCWDERLRASE